MRYRYVYKYKTGLTKVRTKIAVAISILGLGAGGIVGSLAIFGAAHAAGDCTPVSTSKGDMTAAVYDLPVNGPVNASGCDIGVYYDSAGNGDSVKNAAISDSNHYGVFVDGIRGDVTVDITGSNISNTGNHDTSGNFAPNGAQTGVDVYYYGYGTEGTVSGNITGNTINGYQKGGIVVNGSQATVNVTDNTVTGLGRVNNIAQNGVQFGFGSNGVDRGNIISDNFYTGTVGVGPNPGGQNPPGWQYISAGLLLYQPGNVSSSMNHYSDNQRNVSMTN